MIKAVIFDMDGVIFDTIPFAQKTLMEDHPGMTDEMYKEIHAGNFHEEVKKFVHLKIKRTKEEAEKHKDMYSEAKSKSKVFPEIKELLEELHERGAILILNTGAYTQNTIPLLEYSKLNRLFDFIADGELSKSKVEKFKMIESKFSLAKEDCLFITDAVGDLKEAEIAQIPTVAVTWGVHDESYFTRNKYKTLKAIVHSPSELKNFIGAYNPSSHLLH